MKQRYSFDDCYKILLINPECSWEELRRAYKLQIKRWHPDRYDINSPEKQIAEDKVKYITAAYKQLFEYHRIHGTLPVPARNNGQRQDEFHSNPKFDIGENHQTSQNDTSNITSRSNPNLRFIIIFIIICSFIYATFIQHSDDNISQLSQKPSPIANKSTNIQNTNKEDILFRKENASILTPEKLNNSSISIDPSQKAIIAKEKKEDNAYFTYGSSIGDVINIQGTPTRVEGETWFYGESEVHFSNGTVLNWKRVSGSPLKARINLNNTNTESNDSNPESNTLKSNNLTRSFPE